MEDVILNKLESLSAQIQELKQSMSPTQSYTSTTVKDLFAALSKAQGQYKRVGYNRENPYFKNSYADLDAIMESVRPALSMNGLGFIQQIRINDEGQTILHSILTHASGEWIESRSRIIPAKNDAQAFGSTLTYNKRYAAISLLGVTVGHDVSDDDAEIAMVESRDIIARGTALNTKYNPKDVSAETITKEQLEEMEYELSEYPDIGEQILDGMKIQSLADLPKSKFLVSINRVREIKRLRNTGS